jgi:SNF2 family DNA or RNA helicase
MPNLYGFQQDCLNQLWSHRIETGDTSALIGDDMGLGKTVEAIAWDCTLRKADEVPYVAKTLVVTMTSVMGAWEKHFAEWAPWLKVKVIDRKNREAFVKALKAKDANGYPAYHVFICHWQSLRYMADELKGTEWFHIIGDEIQNIKNRKAQQTQVYKKLRTKYKTGLSGTWADNKPDDAWSVLNWLWPKKFTSYWGFVNHHVIQKKHNEGTCEAEGCDKYHRRAYAETAGIHDEALIHSIMGKAYVRRMKEAVWEDIPEKTYEDREVELDPKQRKTYDAMATDMLAWIGENEDQPVAAPAVISQLVRLQQFAVAYGRMEVVYKNGEQFNQLVLDDPSSKLDACIDIIEATNAQIVIFGQSKQAINLLARRLDKAKVSYGLLTGDTKQTDRDLFIKEFQAGSRRVFLSTIKAGGVGITLTAATVCIFLDRAWSPSANRQAEDRLHRLGQKNAVLIITLVARDTIDASRNESIELKWTWLKKLLEVK